MIAAPATANVAVNAKLTSNDGKGDIHGNGDGEGNSVRKRNGGNEGQQHQRWAMAAGDGAW